MSNNYYFKCLFELNSSKYSVIVINNKENPVCFESLLMQIKIQTKNQNISMESHLFEIFDNDFEEYVVIINGKQLIKHLSRIRAQLKDISSSDSSSLSSFEQSIVSNKTSKCSQKSSDCLISKSLLDFNSNQINTTDKVKNYLQMNESRDEIQSKHSFSQNSYENQSTICCFDNNLQKNSVKTENTFYEEVLYQKTNNSVKQESDQNSKHNNSSISSNELKPKDLSELSVSFADQSSQLYYNNENNTTVLSYFNPKVLKQLRGPKQPSLNFKSEIKLIENQMIYVLDFNPEEVNAYNLLLKSMLEFCADFQTIPNLRSSSKNTFWKDVSNLMIRHGFDNWNHQKCYQCFNESLDLYETVLSKTPNLLIASKVYPLFDSTQNFKLTFYNDIQELKTEFEENCAQSTKQESNMISKDLTENQESNKNSSDSESKPHLYLDKKVLEPKYHSNTFTLNYDLKVEKIENQFLYVLKFSEREVKAYKLLMKTMKQNINLFINYSFDEISVQTMEKVWKPISRSLHEYQWNPQKCIQSFNQSVKLYEQILIKAPNRSIASIIYPLFDFIHSFDLKPFLYFKRYDKLLNLINEFEMKFNQIPLNTKPICTAVENVQSSQISENVDTSLAMPQTYFTDFVIETPHYFKLRFKLEVETIENKLLYVLKFRKRDVSEYKLLLNTMSENVHHFSTGLINEKLKISCEAIWKPIFESLVKHNKHINYKLNPENCYIIFIESVRLYQQVLSKAPNRLLASKVYPLFEIIYDFDLKPFLKTVIYDQTVRKRKMFEKRCDQS